jgi:hypothetical protein
MAVNMVEDFAAVRDYLKCAIWAGVEAALQKSSRGKEGCERHLCHAAIPNRLLANVAYPIASLLSNFSNSAYSSLVDGIFPAFRYAAFQHR